MNEPWVYIVLLGMLILVLSSIIPKNKDKSEMAGPGMLKELEETMDGFLVEIEENNTKLLDTVSLMKQEHELAVQKLAERVLELEKLSRNQDQELKRLAMQRLDDQQMVQRSMGTNVAAADFPSPSPTAASPAPDKQEEEQLQSVRSRYSELFQMHHQGKSTEYIAKKLSMNKGEVNLIIQLSKQEERQGAEK